ncbi:unnamed protein product [Paramecium pentaurelia]|uniref:Uncharacterized protein n=1 Tax=Paramecium pentaurelia TaxID=43138 RepID=A0A8S1W813_9CILI|nr:unnamed protein product [Paramecium pentaurelia]
MNQSYLLQLFTQPIAEGLSIVELDQFLDYIAKVNSNQENQQSVDLYMENNFSLKLIMIMRTIYHFDSIMQMNPQKYNSQRFKSLVIFATQQLRKLSQITSEQDQQIIFSLSIHLGIKYFKSHNKLISHLIGIVFEAFQEKNELFDYLLQQMSQSLASSHQQMSISIISILFILDQLLRFLFDIRTLDQQLQMIIEQIFQQLQYIDYANIDIQVGKTLSSIIVICIQKYNCYQQEKLLILSQDQHLLKFIQMYLLQDQIITSNLVKSLSILIKNQQQVQAQLKFDQQQIPYLGQLTNQVLPLLIQSFLEKKFEHSTSLSVLQFVNECLSYSFSYDFFLNNQQQFLFNVIFDNLIFDNNDHENFNENSTNFYEDIQAIINFDNDTIKSLIAQILDKLSKNIDGFLKNYYDLANELLLFHFEVIQETTLCNKLQQEIIQCNFFTCSSKIRYNAIMLSFCILNKQLTSRKDVRQSIEYFLKQNLKYMKKKADSLGKCLGMEFIKLVLPLIFSSSDRSFTKCIKFCFGILNQTKQKRGVKFFAVKCLIHLIQNQDIQLKMEDSLAFQHHEFCVLLSLCDLDIYYEFASIVVQNCNVIIDTYLDDIMKAIAKRIDLGCKKINLNQTQYINHTSIVFSCIKIIDTILSQSYTQKYIAQIEPTLIQILNQLLQPENLLFVDEIFDAGAKFIAYTKGLTEIIHIIFDSLPSIMEKEGKLTIESVFRLFLQSTIHASEVIKSKSQWISIMLKFVYSELQKNYSIEDNIRISILIQIFYQYYNLDECCLLLTEQFYKILSLQLQQKEILPKTFISIFMPVIMDNSKLLNVHLRQIIINTSGYLNLTFGRALTVYNYKFYFIIIHFLILNSNILYEEQHRHQIIEQLFNNFLNKYAAYIEKISFHQKIGNPNFSQQMEKSIPSFDLEYQDNQLELHLKEMSNYKKENQIEKPNIMDLESTYIMSQNQQTQIVQNILQYLKINYPAILSQLTSADQFLLNSILQIKEVDAQNQLGVRQIMNVKKLQRKTQNQKQYNVM